MYKFRVYGVTQVVVTKEIWANCEDDAIGKAFTELPRLTEYGGNGGWDKLVGVEEDDETVSADGEIQYDYAEVIEEDDRFECPECGSVCEQHENDNVGEYWWCERCEMAFDDEGYQFDDDEVRNEWEIC